MATPFVAIGFAIVGTIAAFGLRRNNLGWLTLALICAGAITTGVLIAEINASGASDVAITAPRPTDNDVILTHLDRTGYDANNSLITPCGPHMYIVVTETSAAPSEKQGMKMFVMHGKVFTVVTASLNGTAPFSIRDVCPR